MNNEIRQINQSINYKDILDRKFHPVWFFTNECLGQFLPKIKNLPNIKKVFSVGGSGDFAFNLLLPFPQLIELNVCDIRPLANLTIDLKISLIKSHSQKELVSIWRDNKSSNKMLVYQKIRPDLNLISQKLFDNLINNSRENNFIQCLRQSGYWYKGSFDPIGRQKEYLPYLNPEQYQNLQKNTSALNIYAGDFYQNLLLFPDQCFNLIYLSNILDSRKYYSDQGQLLKIIQQKITPDGWLMVSTQNQPKKIISLLKKVNLEPEIIENHPFNLITALLGHYCYSFLLLKNIQ